MIFIAFVSYMFFRIALIIFNDNMRGIPSIYNLVVISSGYLVFRLVYFSKNFDAEIIRSFSSLFVFTITFYQVIYCFSLSSGDFSLQHSSLLGMFFGETKLPGIMEAAKTATYTRREFGFGDVIPRVVFLAEFPTTSALILLVTYNFYFRRNIKRISYKKLFFMDFLVLMSMLYTQSRVMLLAYLLALVSTYLFLAYRNRKAKLFLYSMFPFIIAIVFFVLLYVAEVLASFRASSGAARFDSYWLGLKLVYDNNFLFGLGVKPRVETLLGIPIGSHSTFVSSLVKFGIVGLIFSIYIFIIYPVNCMIKILLSTNIDDSAKLFVIRSVPIMLLWMTFQDVDAYVVAAVLIFSTLGLITKDLHTANRSIVK